MVKDESEIAGSKLAPYLIFRSLPSFYADI